MWKASPETGCGATKCSHNAAGESKMVSSLAKQHILSEIKRTAAANRHAPLGRLRFARETGIKVSDWLGVYWARWSDAVREAGFAANQKTAAYAEGFLIEKFIALMRELRRFPVGSELRLKAQTESGFPAHNTLSGSAISGNSPKGF